MTKIEALEKVCGMHNSFVYQIKKADPAMAKVITKVAIEGEVKNIQRQIAELQEKLNILLNAE